MISRNIWVNWNGQGYTWNYVFMWKGLLEIRTKGQGSFWKKGYKNQGFFKRMGGEGGPKCKTAIHPLPPIAK